MQRISCPHRYGRVVDIVHPVLEAEPVKYMSIPRDREKNVHHAKVNNRARNGMKCKNRVQVRTLAVAHVKSPGSALKQPYHRSQNKLSALWRRRAFTDSLVWDWVRCWEDAELGATPPTDRGVAAVQQGIWVGWYIRGNFQVHTSGLLDDERLRLRQWNCWVY